MSEIEVTRWKCDLCGEEAKPKARRWKRAVSEPHGYYEIHCCGKEPCARWFRDFCKDNGFKEVQP